MPMRIGTPLPSLADATEWLSSAADEVVKETEARPVLIHFWSVSCGICKDHMPRITEWRTQHRHHLSIVAVHMPRYPEDTNVDAVRETAAKFGITGPLAIDNGHQLRDAFQNDDGYVPAYYLFDTEHRLKSFAAGEYGIKVIGPAIERLLGTAETAGAG